MTVKVSAKLTKEEQAQNGLDALRKELIDQPRGTRYAVVSFEVLRIQTEVADGEVIPTVRLTHIEPLDGDAADQARQLLEGQYERRTGRAPQLELDFGVEDQGVPEPSAEEILAERREAREAGGQA